MEAPGFTASLPSSKDAGSQRAATLLAGETRGQSPVPSGMHAVARPEASGLRSPLEGRTHAGGEEATAPSGPTAKAKCPLAVTAGVTDSHIARRGSMGSVLSLRLKGNIF